MESDEFQLKKKGMSVKVYNNDIEKAIATLKRRMNTEGVNKELRSRKHYEPPTVKRRKQLAEAKLRWRKRHAQIMELDAPVKKTTKPTKPAY
tara:strand:+ start:7631 stop:7906 length:276 start_codon:yes stop_codon:yes gene_type:complete